MRRWGRAGAVCCARGTLITSITVIRPKHSDGECRLPLAGGMLLFGDSWHWLHAAAPMFVFGDSRLTPLGRSVFLQFGNFNEDSDFEVCVDVEGSRELEECEDLFDEVA